MNKFFKACWTFLTSDITPKKRNSLFTLYEQSVTIPQAFDYPDEQFEKLVNELTFFIKPDDRVSSFANYLESPLFQQYQINLNNPNHAAIIGYAFCLALILQHELLQKTVIEDVLNTFARVKEQKKEDR